MISTTMRNLMGLAICVLFSGWVAARAAQPDAPLTPEQKRARVAAGAAGIPALVADLGKADWDYYADSCGDTAEAGLLEITRELSGQSAACANALGDVLVATVTTSAQRYGILLGIAGLNRVPSVFYDGLVAALSDSSSTVRMRASEILARLGDRRAAAAIKSAMRRETALPTKHRMAYHLYQLGDPEGDSLGHRR